MAATKNDSLLLFAIHCYTHCALCTASASEQIERKKKEKKEKRKTHQLREFVCVEPMITNQRLISKVDQRLNKLREKKNGMKLKLREGKIGGKN